MAHADFRAGLARLTALGLSLDAWQFHPQLPDTIDLARAMPNANIIVGHCGGPLGYRAYAGKKDDVFAGWKANLVELAKCDNVVMKMGIGYAALWNAFKRITAGASPDEKTALYSGTARRAYRLE